MPDICIQYPAKFNIHLSLAYMYVCVCVLIGLNIGENIHPFDTPQERYRKLVKVCCLSDTRTHTNTHTDRHTQTQTHTRVRAHTQTQTHTRRTDTHTDNQLISLCLSHLFSSCPACRHFALSSWRNKTRTLRACSHICCTALHCTSLVLVQCSAVLR